MPVRLGAIHRKLIVRLVLAAVLLAAILGTSTFLFERRQLQKQIMEMARVGIDVFRAEASRILSARPGSGRLALPPMAEAPHTDLGRFVFAAFYDTAQILVGYHSDGSAADTRRFIGELGPLQPDRASERIELGSVFRFANEQGMPFVVAVTDDRGRLLGYVKGIFVPSPQTEADIRRTSMRASGLAIVFVFVTALIVYPIIRGLITRLERQAVRLVYANIDTIRVLGCAIAKRDSDTDAHNYRVTFYAVRLAEAVGLDEKRMRGLIKGAFLHDVGKIAIRDGVLMKTASLDASEFAEMQSHVPHGLEIVGHSAWLADAVEVVGCHHEKIDGSGYPNHLAGEDIPITARIFAVADVFDALTSVRPYKAAFSPERALAIMQESAGRHLDSELFAVFKLLAPSLYAEMHMQGEALQGVLSEIALRYFSNMIRATQDEALNGEPAGR